MNSAALVRRAPRRPIAVAVVLAWTLLTLGCQVQFVAPYDQETFDKATDLLKRIESFFVKMDRAFEAALPSEDAKYEKHVAFYDDLKVDLAVLRSRAQAIPQNEDTVKLLDLLAGQFADLERLHRIGLNRNLLGDTRNAIKRTIEQILRTEFAKRRR
jgi:hypothetical protein